MANTSEKDSLKERAKELARKKRREAYQRQKEYRRKLREAEKAKKAEEKRRMREEKDSELWKLLKPRTEMDTDEES